MAVKYAKNMGSADRITRGALGGLMLLNGLTHLNGGFFRRLETLVGGAFLVYGLTGFDPLLKAYGASTIPGAEDNVLHQLKRMAPGNGINPMLTQQASPQKNTRGMRAGQTIKEATAVR